jgi:uncharacterized protein (DUF58 family)
MAQASHAAGQDHLARHAPHATTARVRLRPTNAAWYLLMILLFVLAGAINYQSNAAYLVIAVVGSTAVMALLHGWRNLHGVRLEPLGTVPVFAGEPLRARVRVAGAGRERWALVLDAPEIDEDDGVPIPHLPGDSEQTVELVLPGRRRGRHTLARVRLASVHPLGLVAMTLAVPVAWSWVVYPRPLGGGREPDAGGGDDTLGQRRASIGDFNGHRAYQPGEPHRRIDWRAVARGRPWLVKDHSAGGAGDGWIAWEDEPQAEVETRLSLLAGRVVEADQDGRRYGLRLPGVTIAPGQGAEHRHACLTALALHGIAS